MCSQVMPKYPLWVDLWCHKAAALGSKNVAMRCIKTCYPGTLMYCRSKTAVLAAAIRHNWCVMGRIPRVYMRQGSWPSDGVCLSSLVPEEIFENFLRIVQHDNSSQQRDTVLQALGRTREGARVPRRGGNRTNTEYAADMKIQRPTFPPHEPTPWTT